MESKTTKRIVVHLTVEVQELNENDNWKVHSRIIDSRSRSGVFEKFDGKDYKKLLSNTGKLVGIVQREATKLTKGWEGNARKKEDNSS